MKLSSVEEKHVERLNSIEAGCERQGDLLARFCHDSRCCGALSTAVLVLVFHQIYVFGIHLLGRERQTQFIPEVISTDGSQRRTKSSSSSHYPTTTKHPGKQFKNLRRQLREENRSIISTRKQLMF